MNSIYIHFPYCQKKCSYCDFFSVTDFNSIESYVNALLKEIDLRLNSSGKPKKLKTLFIGGGTPSIITAIHLETIFKKITEYFQFAKDIEITLECNPGTVELEKLIDFKSIGINRISLGVQSYIQEELNILGRIHDKKDVYNSVKNIRKAGYDNLSLDLIYEIPNQSLGNWKSNLSEAIALKPEHLSLYSLTYEKGTPLYQDLKKNKIKKTSEKLQPDFFLSANEILTNAGYSQYEVSNYSKPGRRCKHNINYWKHGQYWGFGPSAHGFINGVRYWNPKNIQKYLKSLERGILPTEESEKLTKLEELTEYIFLGLRAVGIDTIAIQKKFNINLNNILEDLINDLIEMKLLKKYKGLLSLTAKGYLICDEITIKMLNLLEQKISF